LEDGYVPYAFVSRMRRRLRFDLAARAQTAHQPLHLYAASGELKGFVFPYLVSAIGAPSSPDLPRRASRRLSDF